VIHDPAVPLQILAGPGSGADLPDPLLLFSDSLVKSADDDARPFLRSCCARSGKTRVVASRIAHLIDEHGIPPKDIVSVTFTNKAAAEMKTRLERFIGPERTEKLVLGTFHSVCVRSVLPPLVLRLTPAGALVRLWLTSDLASTLSYLRPYHALVGLPAKFVIQDQDDCLKQIKALMQPELSRITKAGEGRIKRPEGWIQGQISKAKAKNQTPEDLRTIAASSATGSDADELPLIVADVRPADLAVTSALAAIIRG
jgi:DNA helicase-2/ATP-dependent DNA helicase PcrA